jgi:Do/DeqQ family serine protease
MLLLACGVVAGIVLTGQIRQAGEARAQAPAPVAAVQSAAATQTAAAAAPVSSPLPDFTRVAERTVPAVANISSTQVVRRPNSPYANDPFYRFFYGDQDEVFGSRRGVESSLGSGVIIGADGYILTNNHVVTGDRQRVSLRDIDITVALNDKRELPAQVVGVDPETDLALLKVNARNLPTITWGDSSRLKVAEWVLAIGNPYQLSQSVTLGIVSATGRNNIGLARYEDFIQTDAAINPGNSGGALVSARGELVGINTAIFSESGGYQGIGFAVPSNLARRVAADLQQYREVRRGSIGYLGLRQLTTEMAQDLGVSDTRGVFVDRMYRNSPTYEAGMRPGDVIVSFNTTAVADGSQLSRMVDDARIGSTATIGVIREGRRVDLKVPVISSSTQTQNERPRRE